MTTYAPRTPLEAVAWRASRAPGAWRWDWFEEKGADGKTITRHRPHALVMAEALARCVDAGPDDGPALVGLLTAIEMGEATGRADGWDPKHFTDDGED